VAVGAKLALGSQALQRGALEHAVALQVVERGGLETEEPAVDPVLGSRLLMKARHRAVVVQLGHAELQLRSHDGHRRDRAVAGVKREQLPQVDVGDAVGVGRAEARRARQV